MELKYKIWLEEQGEQIFGDGIYRLLVLINKYGSINQAAAKEKMSYRQAWGKIKRTEGRLKVQLLERRIGGEDGGGATLTSEGEKLVKMYGDIICQVDALINEVTKNQSEIFPDKLLK
ncbi:MAG: LysR family transcriptional regulator [Thermoanaerobacterales bacterium]|jgi:molybdate transport system regulatory protein|nr:LysR family transcriptional regulator [Thermoanaerobacterales bacterium]